MNSIEESKNPRIIVIQKLYTHYLNKDSELYFPKHRYKKFIKDVVNGTIERKELIQSLMDKELENNINEKNGLYCSSKFLSKNFKSFYRRI